MNIKSILKKIAVAVAVWCACLGSQLLLLYGWQEALLGAVLLVVWTLLIGGVVYLVVNILGS